MTDISRIKPGARARVCAVRGAGAIRQRLMDMGILPRATIEVARHAPAGGPIWIRIGGSQLSLRRTEAAAIFVTACD